MTISKNHSNRGLDNWLLYNIGDKFIQKYAIHYKGVLYDLGCGERHFEQYFKQYCTDYIGVDWSATLHELKADVLANLNEKFPIDSEAADTIISLSVMEHLCEPQNFLNESYRILKNNGVMILQVPWQWWVHEAPYDFFRYTPYGLEYIFRKAGFDEVTIEASSGFFTTWIVKFNYFSTRFIRGPKLLRYFIKGMLIPLWFIGQVVAPYLDKLDRVWELEAQGYYVVARKTNCL